MTTVKPFNNDRGAVLITALIILLVMTMIGIAGMDETITEDRMLMNFRDRSMAMNSAESSLRATESWLGLQTIKPTLQMASQCTTPPLCGASSGYVVWENGEQGNTWAANNWTWWTTNAVTYQGSGAAPSILGNAASQPRSLVEFREFNATSTSGIASNLNAERSMQGIGWHFYNIYGAGTGYRPETFAVISTTFKKWF